MYLLPVSLPSSYAAEAEPRSFLTTTARGMGGAGIKSKSAIAPQEDMQIRTDFSEVWLFDNIERYTLFFFFSSLTFSINFSVGLNIYYNN